MDFVAFPCVRGYAQKTQFSRLPLGFMAGLNFVSLLLSSCFVCRVFVVFSLCSSFVRVSLRLPHFARLGGLVCRQDLPQRNISFHASTCAGYIQFIQLFHASPTLQRVRGYVKNV